MATHTLEIKDLKTYIDSPEGTGKAVDGIDLTIDKGETFALVGESGCGKSLTALSVMQLLPEPQGYVAGGQILINGTDVTTLSEARMRKLRGNTVSMIFQEPMTSLNPVLTVGEQVSESIRLHRSLNPADARAEAVTMFRKVKLPDPDAIYDEYPHRLSGGMKQRVMIAMALACNPELLIADEPTTALDVTIQEEILTLIKELKKELGSAVLLITHSLAVVSENADNVGVMYGGKIVEKGRVGEIFGNPAHPYTLKLMSSIPSMGKRGKDLETIEGTVPRPTEYAPGCRFSSRCDKEMEGCHETLPKDIEVSPGHTVACLLYDNDFMDTGTSRPLKAGEETISEVKEAVPKAPPKTTIAAAKADEYVLQLRDLRCYYSIRKGLLKRVAGYVKAVDGIELKIKRAKTLALVGESGCGKTTAAKSIIRLLKPSSGEVLINGIDIAALDHRRLKEVRPLMQIIFQDPYSALNPRQKVEDIISEGLRSLKPGLSALEIKEKVNESLRMVGLTPEMASRYPHEFSGGQRQRIGIARAIAVEPQLIIADEPTSALDVSVQAQILNLLKKLQRELGITFLFITHDLGVVEFIADEVAVMEGGKIIEYGAVEDVFTTPQNIYTQRLLRAVPRLEIKP